MSLEQKLEEMTGALKENTLAVRALLAAGGGAKTGAATTKDTKAGKAETKKTISFETVKAALVRVRDEVSKPAAQKIVKDVGKAAAMAEIKEELFPAVIAACEKALEPAADAEETGTDGDDGL